MARRDAGTMYSQAQAITAISQVSTFYIDFFDASHQLAQANSVPMLHVRVNQTFTGANFNFLSINFQDASAAAGQTGPNALPATFENTIIGIANIPKASLFAGNDLILVDLPHIGGLQSIAVVSLLQPDTFSDSPLQRYTQFLYTVDGIPGTGSIDAWLDVL